MINLLPPFGEPIQVPLVGSVPFNPAKEVFLKSLQALPDKTCRVPDGETCSCYCFVVWQSFDFPSQVLSSLCKNGQALEDS